jgi:O-antigen/teichoic acid export membrane protein
MILVARFTATAVMNYGLGIALAWLLVPAQFGVISAVQNVLLLAAALLTAGMPWALAIRIAKCRDDPGAAKPEFRTALLASTGFGILLGAAFAAAQLSGLRLVPSHSAVIAVVVAAEMPLLAVNSVLTGAVQGSRRFRGLGTMQTAEIMVKCAVAVFAVGVVHAGPLGVALSFPVGTLGSVLIGVRTTRDLLPGWGPLASPGFLRASGAIWFASAAMGFLLTADLLGLQVAGGATAATAAVLAGYQACGLLARASFYVSDALADAVFPFLAASRSSQERHRWFVAAARWIPAVIIPLQLGLCLAPGPVLRLFLPHDYATAQTLLRVLAVGTVGTLMTDMLMKGLFAVGQGARAGRLMPVVALVETVCLIVLVPRYGALGAAESYLVASYVSVALLAPIYLSSFEVRLSASWRPVRYVAGLVVPASFFVEANRLASVAWILIAAAAFLSLLSARWNGLITDSDMGAVWAFRSRLTERAAKFCALSIAPGRLFWRSEKRLAVFCASVAGITLGYNLFGSPDILYDEAAYTSTAQKVAQDWQLTLDNKPLFVHPPLMFLLQAGWLRMTGEASATLPSAIHMARLLAASAGGINVLLIAGLAYRLASAGTATRRRVLTGAIAVIAALDPVLVRYDRQDVIEPFALCLCLVTLHAAWHLRERGSLAYVSVTGLLTGLALLTNEITVFLLIVPLIFALLERDRGLLGRTAGALAIGVAFLLLFFLWSVELGQAGSFLDVQTATLQRLIGIVQNTGLKIPGISPLPALRQSVAEYSSSYIVLATGFASVIWCWARWNTRSGHFLTAWLTASYGLAIYLVAIGTLNEQFFVYVLPASIVGATLFVDALIAGPPRAAARRRPGPRPRPRGRDGRLPRLAGLAALACLTGLSAANWVTDYTSPSDGVVLADGFIAARLPACTVVNASGDSEKYSYLLPGRNFSSFYVGPAALAYGVHYFLLSPSDAIERTGNMSPALASWIQQHGRRLALFPSEVYKTVQVWYVPASPYDPVADVVNIPAGLYARTDGSSCGGFTITNGSAGSFYSAYQALGGKAVAGEPLSRVARAGSGSHEQFFDGAVLATSKGRAAHPLPVVETLARKDPRAYRRAGLPPVITRASAATRRSWLTNPAITRTYLDGQAESRASYAAAVQRYGEPLGPPSALPGGATGQAFADVVLKTSAGGGTGVSAAPVTSIAAAAGLLRIPAAALRPQASPPLPEPPPSGPSEPASVRPFAFSLGAALSLYGCVISVLATRQRRWQRAAERQNRWEEAA